MEYARKCRLSNYLVELYILFKQCTYWFGYELCFYIRQIKTNVLFLKNLIIQSGENSKPIGGDVSLQFSSLTFLEVVGVIAWKTYKARQCLP